MTDHQKAIRSALLTAHALYKDIPHVVGGGAPMHDGGIPEGYADGGAVDPAMPEPQKTVKAYKLFRHKDGKLYPLFVNANQEVPIGKWLRAEAGPQGKTEGRVKSKLGDLAYRPGWHSGDMPVATHIGSKSQPGLKAPDTRPPEHVWAEVEHPADVDWQSVAHQRAQIMKSGLPNLATAHITDQVPHGGFYRYKTNPNMTGNWLISGGMKVNRVLPHEEVQAINKAHGVFDLPRREPQAEGFARGGASEMARAPSEAVRAALLTAHALYKHIPHVVHYGKADGGPVDPPTPPPVYNDATSRSFEGLHPQLISQRVPTLKSAQEDPNERMLLVNHAAAQAHPTTYAHNLEQMRQYNQFRPEHTQLPDEQFAEHAINHFAGNQKFVYDAMDPEFRKRATPWYVGANAISHRMAAKHGSTHPKMAANIAAQSPQKDWFQNVSLAERVADIHHAHGQSYMTPEMERKARDIYAEPKWDDLLKTLRRSRYGDLPTPEHKATWLRLYDQTYHEPYYREISPHGDIGDWVRTKKGEKRRMSWGSTTEIGKGIAALESGGTRPEISDLMGLKHKVRNFYNDILDPHSPTDDVTGDTHHVAVSHMMPYGGSATPVAHNFDNSVDPEDKARGIKPTKPSDMTGVRGTYPFYVEATRRLRDEKQHEAGPHSRAIQSIVWEGGRALFPDDFKTPENIAAASQIWHGYQTGAYDVDEARQRILKLAGHDSGVIHDPSPAVGRYSGPPEEAPHSTYARKLPEGGVGGQPAGVDEGAGGNAAALDQGLQPQDVRIAEKHRAITRAVQSLHDPKTGLPQSYARRVRRRGEAQLTGPGGASVKQVFDPTPRAADTFGKVGVSAPQFMELGSGPASADAFHSAVMATREAHPSGKSVWAYEPKEYRKMRMFMTPDGTAGFALKGDDIVSLFNTHGSPHNGIANSALQLALQEGGRRLDAFDTALPHLYGRNHFEAVARTKYWPDAPPMEGAEKFNGGRPDNVYMAFMPKSAQSNIFYDESHGDHVDDEEAAQKIQARVASQTARKLAKSQPPVKVPKRADGGVVDQALALTAPPQPPVTPQGLYSQAGAAAAALPQAKGSPQQMLASLKGIKPEEVRHSGAAERFGNEKSVSREQLAQHFHKALPKIQETRLSHDDVDFDDEGEQVGGPGYEHHSLPNGQNYRELLMHLPEAKPEPPQHVMDAYKRAEKNALLDAQQWRLKNEHTLSDDPDFVNDPMEHPEFANIQSRIRHAQQQQQELTYKANQEAKAKNHYSSHWDTPNVLAHLRMSDRYDPTSPHGDKMLHLEELQSDWGQEGRQKGFKGPNFDRVAAETEAHRLADKLTNGRPERGDRERAIELQRQIKAHDTGVPQGPHVGSTNGWTDLGLKRALVEAARKGHSRLAWTPDAEQDRRYEGRKKAAEGEGGYYDTIVPKRLKEILKKFGHEAQFEPVTITHGLRREHKAGKPVNPEDLRSTLHSVRLPEEVREKILKEGLPAFADGGLVERALRITAHPAKMYAAGGKATKEPDYDVHEDNDFLHVARRNLAQEQGISGGAGPQARGPGDAALAGGDGPLGNGAAQSPSDARLSRLQEVADRHAKAHGNGPVVDAGNSESSLHKQSAIGRAFQLAASGHPGYEADVFKAYQQHHPDLVARSGAKNYHQLKAAAYKQLAKEVKAQFDDLPVAMRFHHEGKHGYPSSAHMRKDVLENGKLAVFRGGDKHEFLHNVHPQHGLTENEMFRAIHDVYGHALHGSGFGAKGEERAWNAHRQMFSPLAALAMSAETRGQNSFVNYTPINAQLTADKHAIEAEIAGARRRGDKEGEKKGLERKRETMEGWQYAPQKAVLLPPEMNRPDYEGGMPDYVQKHVEHEPGTGFSSPITHYSPSADVKELDPSRYGTGIPGDERSRVLKRPGGVKERAYGYLGTPQSTKPEPGLGSNAFVGQAHGLYDLTSDPIKLGLLAQESNRRSPLGNFNPGTVNQAQAMNDVERMAKEHGYSGVANPKAVYPMAAMFNKTPVQPAPQDDTVNKALQLTAPR
jgi:hypothetical protein